MKDKAKRKLEETPDKHLHQASTSKRVRADHMEVNFSTLSFPQKLWYIVESEAHRSIRWHKWGTCVVIDTELFGPEILSPQGDMKIFESSVMKSFKRQLNLYGFRKIRALEGETSFPNQTESDSRNLVFYNGYFRQGHPELLVHVTRRMQVKTKQLRATAFSTRHQNPNPGLSEEAEMEAPEVPLDHSPNQDALSEAPSQSETNSLQLSTARLQNSLAEWILSRHPSVSPSALADVSRLLSRALAQPCSRCGHNALCSENS
ncbi:hypothetical protein NFI96_024117 [Prochilodus magdalenae]|nr:hypothetical protein NFI96_024117 [Prochilodus magdalenae]